MPTIDAVATAVPPHRMSQGQVRRFAAAHFGPHRPDIERLLPIFEHTGIESRAFCVPPEWFRTPRNFQEKNDLYITWCARLGADAAHRCLKQAGCPPAEVDQIIFVSTTGLATPSIDARLVGILGLDSHVRRTPLWGLGCAGGAAGLAHAFLAATADPHARVLLVAVELCSLTFHFNDFSKSNFVATALFADGAASVLVSGDRVTGSPGRAVGQTAPTIISSQSTTWPDLSNVMGWNFDRHGMQVVFSRSIPGIVRRYARADLNGFLEAHHLSLDKVAHMVIHPGGKKVIEAYENALAIPPANLSSARDILRDYGNMSSPTVLFVLERLMAGRTAHNGDYAVLTALGPGFSAENVLLRF